MKNSAKNSYKRANGIFTREVFGITLILFSVISVTLMLLSEALFGSQWFYTRFLYGAMGYSSFALFAGLIAAGVFLLTGKREKSDPARTVLAVLFAVLFFGLIHSATSGDRSSGFKTYVSDCYAKGFGGISTSSGGGAVFAAVSYPFIRYLTPVGAYVAFSLLMAGDVFLIFRISLKREVIKASKPAIPKKEIAGVKDYPDESFDFSVTPSSARKSTLFNGGDSSEFKVIKRSKGESEKPLDIIDPGRPSRSFERPASPEPRSDGRIYDFGDRSYREEFGRGLTSAGTDGTSDERRSPIFNRDTVRSEEFGEQSDRRADEFSTREREDISQTASFDERASRETDATSDRKPKFIPIEEPEAEISAGPSDEIRHATKEKPVKGRDRVISSRVGDDGEFDALIPPADTASSAPVQKKSKPTYFDAVKANMSHSEPKKERTFSLAEERNEPQEDKAVYIGIPDMPLNLRYRKPPVDLFNDTPRLDKSEDDIVGERCEIIEQTLENFEIPVHVENVVHGPTITRYEVSLPHGISVTKVPPKAKDLAMRLAVSSVRIEAPIPGKSLIGIEVPNKYRQTVGIKELLKTKEFTSPSNGLTVVLGQDVVGAPIVTDLTATPHLLVAGATGTGKSVFLNSLIMSLITKYGPDEMRLVIVDPKQVDFFVYEDLPHLLTGKILFNAQHAIGILDWAIDEMERRYTIFKSYYAQKIEEYNNSIDPHTQRKMPIIVIIVDELGDLFSKPKDKAQMEERIIKLVAKARAAGIHLVFATQRPDVSVITGVIKANLPSRVAFKVQNFADSNTILSSGGAEKLLGKGDMIYKNSSSEQKRIQGTYVSMEEIKRVTDYIKKNNRAYFYDGVEKYLNAKKASTQNGGYAASISFESDDPDAEDSEFFNDAPIRYIAALKYVIQKGFASTSGLQRKYGIGYNTAGRMVDWMEEKGYVSAASGSKGRTVYITMDKFEELYGDADLGE